MEAHTLRVLEFSRLADRVAACARTERGRELCRRLAPKPAASFGELAGELATVTLFMDLLEEAGPVPLAGVSDLRAELERLRVEETFLPPRQLLAVAATLQALENICRYGTALEEPFASLRELFAGITAFKPLADLIAGCIDEQEEIRDEASFALGDLRRRLRATRRQVQEILQQHLDNPAYQPIIQDRLITIRNQRYVIPVKPNFRTFFPGIIHDHSNTRMTYFVEPVAIIGLNNSLGILAQEERDEEIRILKMIAGHLRAERPAILAVLERVFQLDFLQARALFGREIGGTAPELLPSWPEGFALRSACHPLLLHDKGAEQVVPVDIVFAPGIQGLVVSGANTGGKTVTLKTLGLVSLMARAGLPLPVAAASRVPLFARVLADIGDEQSLSEDLSTFSGHLKNLDFILRHSDEQTLVLADELGVGTDPREGAALALAVLDELHERQAAFLVTTHYNNVKAYAYENEWVESVAVSFDRETLQPLYTLRYGVPGLSNALQIARKMNFLPAVVRRARNYLEREHDQVVLLAEKLEKNLAQVQQKERELYRLKQEASLLQEKYRRQLAEVTVEKQELRRRARERLREIGRQAEARFRELLREIERQRREGKEEVKTGELRHRFARLQRETAAELLPPAPPPSPPSPPVDFTALVVGDRVRLHGGGQQVGDIEKIDRQKKQVTVCLAGNLRVSLPPEKIAAVLERPAAAEKVTVSTTATGPAPLPTLNVIGKRVDEAREEVSRYLDQAVLGNLRRVEIVHGFGTGRLRSGLHQLLREIPYVRDFHHPPPEAGGRAVTVVELED